MSRVCASLVFFVDSVVIEETHQGRSFLGYGSSLDLAGGRYNPFVYAVGGKSGAT